MQNIQMEFGPGIEEWLEKGFILIEEEQWERAEVEFKSVINSQPKNAQAYLGLLLAGRKLRKEEDLAKSTTSLEDDVNFRMTLRFADGNLKRRLERYNEEVSERVKKEAELHVEISSAVGCVMPLILGVPIAIVIAEIWFLIFWEDFQLINLNFFGHPWADALAYIGLIFAYLTGAFFAWVGVYMFKEAKIRKERDMPIKVDLD